MIATIPRPPFAGFDSWRPGQLETVEAVLQSRRRFQLVTAPTGSGKSLIAAALIASPTNGIGLTATKQLQGQYQTDFPEFSELRGISNYPCAAADGLQVVTGPRVVVNRLDRMATGDVPNHAGAAPCHDAPWKPYRQEVLEHNLLTRQSQRAKGAWVDPCPLAHDGCTYIAARKAVTARPAILNYHVWAALRSLDMTRWPMPIPKVLVCDEAHTLETLICDLVAVTLERPDIDIIENAVGVDVGPLRDAETEHAAAKAAQGILSGLERESPPALSGLDMGTDEITGTATPEKRLRRALDRLTAIARMNVDRWAWEVSSLTAAPLRAADYADVVWGGCERVVLMSATATEHTMAALGIEDVEAVPVAAPTPEERRLVKVPEMPALSFRTMDDHLPGLAHRIEEIALTNRGHAGVIHCHSYRIRDALLTLIHARTAQRCIIHGRGELPDAMARFRGALRQGEAPILLSPTATTGVDFPGDMARWQIVSKFPWPSFGSRIVKRRAEADPEWALRTACATLAQTIGRGVRSADDWCETWILDGAVLTGRVRAGLCRYLPSYVRRAFRRVL